MSTLAAVEKILRESGSPMSAKQIVEESNGSLPTRSKTPDTVVARDLSMDIKRRGEKSIFVRTSPGRYTLRELLENSNPTNATDAALAEEPNRTRPSTLQSAAGAEAHTATTNH